MLNTNDIGKWITKTEKIFISLLSNIVLRDELKAAGLWSGWSRGKRPIFWRDEKLSRAKLSNIHECADFLGVDLIDNQAQFQIIAQEQAGLRMIDFCNSAIARITVEPEKLVISVKTEQLGKLISEKLGIGLRMMFADEKQLIAHIQPAKGKRGTLMIEAPTVPDDILDLPPAELKKIVQGFIWMEEHFSGTSLEEIAQREKVSDSYIGKTIMARLDDRYTTAWVS